ncbi:S41 family peptidase [Inquilinus sp. CAU 1745]|uniref:S41 family peptidase n=1 Tax=Inquilinus sp. CAU 1745 TaxID=3140369 RepID=UPI00325B7816
MSEKLRAMKSRVTRLGLVLVLVGGCSLTTTAEAPVDPDGPLSASVFSVGYGRMDDIYLREVDLHQLSTKGLQGLSAIDPALGAFAEDQAIVLTVGNRATAVFEIPAPHDAGAWASLLIRAIEHGKTESPALRQAGSDRIYEAVYHGILAELDPYSRYVGPKQAAEQRAFRDGYGGVGLLLAYDDEGRPVVQNVYPETPASAAGVEEGSIILAVDGVPVEDFGAENIGARLRGRPDSTVAMTVETPSGAILTHDLKREMVVPNLVETRYEDDVAILDVSGFNTATDADFSEALRVAVETLGPSAEGIILDLRGNPGGLLGPSVAVADAFLVGGEVISTRGRHPDSHQYFDADSVDLAHGLPLIVLVDGQSASGAEVAAAALQDTGRAVVVGASSYGKGSVQTVTRLPNGGELYLTWARIYSPKGYTLDEQGVMPTICTSNGATSAREILGDFREGDLAIPAAQLDLRRAAPDDEEALMLLRAACPWRAHEGELDVAVAKALLEDGGLYGQALAAVESPTLAQR